MKNSTNTIVMVRPANFGVNPETAIDNAFQHPTHKSELEIKRKAQEEFELYTIKLKQAGVNVIIINDSQSPIKPDAIFPNNWFSAHSDGTVFLYPMKAINRRLERSNPVIATIEQNFQINSIVDLTETEKENLFLEGTGSIIFNHIHKVAYACISKRTNKDLFLDFCKRIGYMPITFSSVDVEGVEIYHTNVMMSVTTEFTIVCLESIKDKREKEELINNLKSFGQEIIEVSYQQMNNFCCNVLEVQDKQGKLYLTMSERAYNTFTPEQKSIIKRTHGLIYSPLYTIEDIGGGGSRCMMAEIYLPAK
jgi:hypothetical protein